MKYLLLICGDKNQGPMTAAEGQAVFDAHRRLGDELRAAGKMIHGERLRPETDATRVRAKASQRQVTDGPFAETKEALGGFYLIECEDRKEAVEWAKKIPLRDGGAVDVREIWPM
jgi:hypothetical protein